MYLQFVYFEEREVPVIPVERSPASLSSSWDSCQGHLSSDHTFKLPSNVLVKKLVEKICQTEGKGCGGGGGRVVGQGGSVWLRGLSQVPLQKWVKETCTVWGLLSSQNLSNPSSFVKTPAELSVLPVNSTVQYLSLLCTRLLQRFDGWWKVERQKLAWGGTAVNRGPLRLRLQKHSSSIWITMQPH